MRHLSVLHFCTYTHGHIYTHNDDDDDDDDDDDNNNNNNNKFLKLTSLKLSVRATVIALKLQISFCKDS